MTNMKFQRDYIASLIEDVFNVTEGEIELQLSVAPNSDIGYIILAKGSSKEEVMFYHRRVGANVYVYGASRTNPQTHLKNTQVILVSTIEAMNYLSQLVQDQFFIFKKSSTDVIIKGGKIYDNTELVDVLDLDTSIGGVNKILIGNNTNYVYLDEGELFITQTYDISKYIVGEIYVNSSGIIESIEMYKPYTMRGIQGVPGDNAPEIEIEYSIDGVTLWHTQFASGDFYQRVSTDGGTTWSSAIKFVGEDGDGIGDMLVSVYDPAGGNKQVAFAELTNLASTNLNTIVTNGFYCANATCTNLPEIGVKTRLRVNVDPSNSDLAMQEALTTTTGVSYYRITTNGGSSWTAWARIKANDETKVGINGIETIIGKKTFSSNPVFSTGIEIGNAIDTTITRVGAGRIAVEGIELVRNGDTPTLTSIYIGDVDTKITRAGDGAIAVEGKTLATEEYVDNKEAVAKNLTKSGLIAGEAMFTGQLYRKGIISLGEDINKYYIAKSNDTQYIGYIGVVMNDVIENGEFIGTFDGIINSNNFIGIEYNTEYNISQTVYNTYFTTLGQGQTFTIGDTNIYIDNIKLYSDSNTDRTYKIVIRNALGGTILGESNNVQLNVLGEVTFNFTGITLIANTQYYFEAIWVSGVTSGTYFRYANTNIYSGGNAYDNGVSIDTYDLWFKINGRKILYSNIGSPLYMQDNGYIGITYGTNKVLIGYISSSNELTLLTNNVNIISHFQSGGGTVTFRHGLGRIPKIIKLDGYFMYDNDQEYSCSGYWSNGEQKCATVANPSLSTSATLQNGVIAHFGMISYTNGNLASVTEVTENTFNITFYTGSNPRNSSYIIMIF